MNKLIFIFVINICFAGQVECQNVIKTDSLKLEGNKYLNISEKYLYSDLDSLKLFTSFAADCFLEAGDISQYLFVLSGLVNFEILNKRYTNYPILYKWYENLIEDSKVKNTFLLSNLLNSKATFLQLIGNSHLAKETILQSIKYLESDSKRFNYSLAIYHFNLSKILEECNDLKRSSEELSIAIKLLENESFETQKVVKFRRLARYYFTYAGLNLNNGELELAELAYEKSFNILNLINDSNLSNRKLNDYVGKQIEHNLFENAFLSMPLVREKDLITYTDSLKYYSNKIQLGLDNKIRSQLFHSMSNIIKKIDEPIERQKEYLHFLDLQIEELNCDSKSQMVSKLDSIYGKQVFEFNDFNISKKFDLLLKKITQDVEREKCLNTNEFVFLKRYFNKILDNIQTEDSKYQLQNQIHQFQNLIFENISMEDLPSSILFELFEFNKSLVLLSSIDRSRNSKVESNHLKEELIDQRQFLNHIKEELANFNAKDAEGWSSVDSTISSNLKFELAKAKNDLDFLENQYYEKYPHEKHFVDSLLIEPSQIQKSLKSNEVLIETFWSENSVNFLLISDAEMNHFSLKNSDFMNFKNLVSSLKVNQKSSEFQNTFLQISELLSLDNLNILNDKTKLIIVPDGPINNLPFELLSRNGNRLLNDFSISYQYSYKLLTVLQQNSNKKFKKEFLGVSFPTNETIASSERLCDDLELLKLSCAKNEVANIENILNLKNSQSDLNTNEFIKQSNEARIIHIASHACPDEENHQLSRIHFKDDFLTNYDISAMNLNADLAVLSACETGYGKIIEGEGAMTIARAFFHAGVKTNIVSLWKVDDCSTADLMKYFYQHLADGEDSDVALQNAKLDFVENSHPQYHHPYYWAGFIHMGDTASIFAKSNNVNYYLLGMCVLVIIGIGLKGNRFPSKNAA